MPRGMPTGTIVFRVERYAAVKLRQRIREELLKTPEIGYVTLFHKFLRNGWIPDKENGEPLEEYGFKSQFKRVQKDLNHNFSDFFICFLSRALIVAYKDFHKKGTATTTYNGAREIVNMTGLQETTIRDILILNGEIE